MSELKSELDQLLLLVEAAYSKASEAAKHDDFEMCGESWANSTTGEMHTCRIETGHDTNHLDVNFIESNGRKFAVLSVWEPEKAE